MVFLIWYSKRRCTHRHQTVIKLGDANLAELSCTVQYVAYTQLMFKVFACTVRCMLLYLNSSVGGG